jgi:hypothetical protein
MRAGSITCVVCLWTAKPGKGEVAETTTIGPEGFVGFGSILGAGSCRDRSKNI